MNFLERFKYSLAKTRATIISHFVSPQWNAQEMERALIAADFGPHLSSELVQKIKQSLETNPYATREQAIHSAKAIIESYLNLPQNISALEKPVTIPFVILMAGVNGTGKTTSTAKLAHYFKTRGGKVLLAAADTFRAAAIDQLRLWGNQIQIEVHFGKEGADPSSVAFDAIKKSQSENFTHLIVDTAGRQHTKSNLMNELQKIKRVMSKAFSGAPHETWLVLDATTGNNGLSQAKEFHATLQLTGLIITKLDGTAKGGIVIQVAKELQLPIFFVGLGEAPDDLQPFDPKTFSSALWSPT